MTIDAPAGVVVTKSAVTQHEQSSYVDWPAIIAGILLVTALNLDVGRAMWWPSRLARRPDEPEEALPPERLPAEV